jgi:serine protease AprX
MRFNLILFVFLLAQIGNGQEKYWVHFMDKPHAKELLVHPEIFLSDRCLENRTKRNIEITEQDVPLSNQYLAQVAALDGVRIINKSKWFNSISVEVKHNDLIDRINAFTFVKSVASISAINSRQNKVEERNDYNKLVLDTSEGFKATYGDALAQLELYNLLPLHIDGFKGKGMLVAVFDAGFYLVDTLHAFNYIRDNNQIKFVRDFVDGDNDPFHSSYHGSAVLSTIAAYREGEIIGSAYEADFVLCRTENGASETLIEEDNWVAAAEWADSLGVDVINSSLGYTEFDSPASNHTYADMDGNTTIISRGADIAASKGILVVNSAGNSGQSSWKYIGAPADADSILTVGAVDVSGNIAPFSSYGPSSDGQIKPNVCAVGWQTTVVSVNDDAFRLNGTSFSSPLMAGAVASLWSKFPEASNMEIIKAVELSSSNYNNPDDRCGYGIPDMSRASDSLDVLLLKKYQSEIGLYPNPTNRYINLVTFEPTKQIETIQIFDLTGKMVFQNYFENKYLLERRSIDLLEVPAGVYNLKLTYQDGGVLTEKLIKVTE